MQWLVDLKDRIYYKALAFIVEFEIDFYKGISNYPVEKISKLEQRRKDFIICLALSSKKGRKLLAKAMIEPIEILFNEQAKLRKALLNVEPMEINGNK